MKADSRLMLTDLGRLAALERSAFEESVRGVRAGLNLLIAFNMGHEQCKHLLFMTQLSL